MILQKRKDYICYYEGLQEEKYFIRLKELIEKTYPNIRIRFNRVNKFNYFIELPSEVKKIAIFDYDLNNENFEFKVKKCLRMGVSILYSNLNFDLWLILHKELFATQVTYNDDYQDKIRKIYNLSLTANIKKEENIDKILKQIELHDIQCAIKNANKIMETKDKNDLIIVNSKFSYYSNPSLSIQNFLITLEKELNINFE